MFDPCHWKRWGHELRRVCSIGREPGAFSCVLSCGVCLWLENRLRFHWMTLTSPTECIVIHSSSFGNASDGITNNSKVSFKQALWVCKVLLSSESIFLCYPATGNKQALWSLKLATNLRQKIILKLPFNMLYLFCCFYKASRFNVITWLVHLLLNWWGQPGFI